MPRRDRIEQEVDRLYGLAPSEFTTARNRLAKDLRQRDRSAAERVSGLRKPSLPAWIANQLARRRRRDVDELLEAGEALRAAQEELLAGGDRTALREASKRERELVARLLEAAEDLAGESGLSLSPGVAARLASTLHAASVDDETRRLLETGRLVREREAAGLGPLAPGEPPPSRRPSRARRRDEKPGRLQALQAQLADARSREREARREASAAARALAAARADAEAALDHLARAEQHEDHARSRAAQTKTEVERARTELNRLRSPS
jgi:hypothetical protein